MYYLYRFLCGDKQSMTKAQRPQCSNWLVDAEILCCVNGSSSSAQVVCTAQNAIMRTVLLFGRTSGVLCRYFKQLLDEATDAFAG